VAEINNMQFMLKAKELFEDADKCFAQDRCRSGRLIQTKAVVLVDKDFNEAMNSGSRAVQEALDIVRGLRSLEKREESDIVENVL